MSLSGTRPRIRKTPKIVVWFAMLGHAVETRHPAEYRYEKDGLDGYLACKTCGARVLIARAVIKGAGRSSTAGNLR